MKLIQNYQCVFLAVFESKTVCVFGKRNQAQAISIVHKVLMKKTKQQCTHLTTEEIKRIVRFREPSSYVQHIALEKEQTSPVLLRSLHRFMSCAV